MLTMEDHSLQLKTQKTSSFPHTLVCSLICSAHIIGSYAEPVKRTQILKREERLSQVVIEHGWDGVLCWKPWTPPSGMGVRGDHFRHVPS